MSDYSFMRTGIGNNSYSQQQEEIENKQKELMSLVMVFSEDAIKLWGIYTEHAGRHVAVEQDLQKALKVRSFHGNEFWQLPDVQQKINEHRRWIENLDQSDEDDDDEEMDIEEDNNEPYTYSQCNCTVCVNINQIDNLWNSWNPTETTDIILKNAIEKTYNNL